MNDIRPISKGALLWMILGGGMILFLAIGTRQSFALFQLPLTTEKQWGREIFSIAIALQNIVWGLAQPIAGMIADRYGAGRVAIGGALLYAVGLYLMATPDSPLMLYLGSGVVIGMALAATSFALVLGAIGKSVPPERQGMVLGIASALGSVGQFALIPGGAALISWLGWSDALIALGAAMAIIILCAHAIRSPSRAQKQDIASASTLADQSVREALREAMAHPGYWLLMAGFFVCGFQITFIATHIVAYVQDSGLSLAIASGTLSLIGLLNIVGSFACSALGDHYRRKYLLSLLYLARAALMVGLLILPLTPFTALAFGGVMGILWLGTVPLTTSLVAQIFGVRYMTMLFGIVFLAHQIGAALGVWMGGYLYDTTGSYDVVWMIAAGLGVVAAVLHWPIQDRPVARLNPVHG